VRLVSLWFFGTSCLLGIGGSIWLVYTLWFVAHASKTEGRIVAMERRDDSKGHATYSPVFTYNDASSVTHTQSCSMSSSSFSYEVGEKVTVLYDPARPINSKIDTFTTIWLFPLVLIGMSLFSGSFVAIWFIAASSIIKKRQT
jgi:Protein of unknown function (DUF3592)